MTTSINSLKRDVAELVNRVQLNQPQQIIIQLVDPDDNSVVYENWVVMTNGKH